MSLRQSWWFGTISTFGFLGGIATFAQETQTMPPVVLRIDSVNFVRYDQDTPDWSKFATIPGVASPLPFPIPPFGSYIGLADVTAVNGRPVRGVRIFRLLSPNFAKNAASKQAVADLGGGPFGDQVVVIQNLDGSVIGALVTTGLGITDPAPAAQGLTGYANIVAGGTGSFLGVTGQACGAGGGGTPPGGARRASVAEDPANRRTNGGGTTYQVLCLIPRTRPEVLITTNGPAVGHAADFSLVTSANPAKPGELLVLVATGLGPTKPGVDPGQPFTDNPLQLVNGPVEIMINGQPAEVLYAGGYPGTTDMYQVNFRLPAGASSGMASLRLIAAWIPGGETKLPVQ